MTNSKKFNDIHIQADKAVHGEYRRPDLIIYRLAQLAAFFLAVFVFKRRILRNEIRSAKGPYVVIANHQAAYDFVNLIGATSRRMSFVLSNSFYNSLSIKGLLDRMGVIPKQQFQTAVSDMKKMKAVVNAGQPLVIYPAGLMCEDGLSTPIPKATYKFLKWLGVDIYVAKTYGTYFAMPKWTKGFRPGRTYIDIYKLISAEELGTLSVEDVKAVAEKALMFDAYREQEKLQVKYANNNDLEGLQSVLYMCPHCLSEFTMEVNGRHTLRCTDCGYEEYSDEYALLHKKSDVGEELRYVSDWSRMIFERTKERIRRDHEYFLSAQTSIHMLDRRKKKFAQVGSGTLKLTQTDFTLCGEINGSPAELVISSAQFPTLPFTPGKYLELQCGQEIYRCVLHDGRLVMKFINFLKASYELRNCDTSA